MKSITLSSVSDLQLASKLIWQTAANDPQAQELFEEVLSNPELVSADIFKLAFQMGASFTLTQMMQGRIGLIGKGPGG